MHGINVAGMIILKQIRGRKWLALGIKFRLTNKQGFLNNRENFNC
jgi:hypothetical protein